MIEEILNKEKKQYYLILTILTILMLGIILISVTLGKADITISESFKIILKKIFNKNIEIAANKEAIIWDIRMPRIISGLIIGAGLAVAGTIFQAILRNPLADPYTIGVSTGAAFGAVLTIYINIVYSLFLPIVPVAFIFSIITLFIIVKIAGFNQTLHSSRLILAGIIISSTLSAAIGLLKSMAGEDVSAMIFWLMGNLAAKSWTQVLILFPTITIAIILAKHFANDLDILTLGIHEAKNIGVDSERLVKFYLVIGAFITAVCVSISGIIGFVGLVIPHLVRMSFTSKHKYLIPISSLVGAIVLSLADNITRLMFVVEIPVGVLTTLIGGPFFIYIYLNKSSGENI